MRSSSSSPWPWACRTRACAGWPSRPDHHGPHADGDRDRRGQRARWREGIEVGAALISVAAMFLGALAGAALDPPCARGPSTGHRLGHRGRRRGGEPRRRVDRIRPGPRSRTEARIPWAVGVSLRPAPDRHAFDIDMQPGRSAEVSARHWRSRTKRGARWHLAAEEQTEVDRRMPPARRRSSSSTASGWFRAAGTGGQRSSPRPVAPSPAGGPTPQTVEEAKADRRSSPTRHRRGGRPLCRGHRALQKKPAVIGHPSVAAGPDTGGKRALGGHRGCRR